MLYVDLSEIERDHEIEAGTSETGLRGWAIHREFIEAEQEERHG